MNVEPDSAEDSFSDFVEFNYRCKPKDLDSVQEGQLRTAYFGGIYVGILTEERRPEVSPAFQKEIKDYAKSMRKLADLDRARGIDE